MLPILFQWEPEGHLWTCDGFPKSEWSWPRGYAHWTRSPSVGQLARACDRAQPVAHGPGARTGGFIIGISLSTNLSPLDSRNRRTGNPDLNPNPTRSARGPASAGLDRGCRPVEGLNRQNFSDLLPAKQFCCRPGQLLIICAGGVGLRKSKMSSWRQGDDEKASMQGPVPTVQRNGNRRFVTTVSGRLLLLRILEPPKAAS